MVEGGGGIVFFGVEAAWYYYERGKLVIFAGGGPSFHYPCQAAPLHYLSLSPSTSTTKVRHSFGRRPAQDYACDITFHGRGPALKLSRLSSNGRDPRPPAGKSRERREGPRARGWKSCDHALSSRQSFLPHDIQSVAVTALSLCLAHYAAADSMHAFPADQLTLLQATFWAFPYE